MTTTDPQPRRARQKRRRYKLTEQQERDLIQVYADTNRSITEIARMFDVQSTYPYRVLDKNGIGWRRGNPESFRDWARDNGRLDLIEEAVEPQPESLRQRLAAELNQDTGFTTPALLQQVTVDEAYAERAVPDLPLDFAGPPVEWTVEITERFSVSANSIEAAVAEARKARINGRITGIRLRDL